LLVSIGTGGIKPCVASFGGDQFTEKHSPKLLTSYFAIFYMCINIGSTFSSFLTPLTMQYAGYAVAFAIPAVVLLLSSLVFTVGYKAYKHVPPSKNNVFITFIKITFVRTSILSISTGSVKK
jgi:dipeptide/tripeptide permease